MEEKEKKRKVGILLGIGIFFLPVLFSWFTVRKGHSTLSRVLSFVWLGLFFLIFGDSGSSDHSETKPVASNEAIPMPSKSDKIVNPGIRPVLNFEAVINYEVIKNIKSISDRALKISYDIKLLTEPTVIGEYIATALKAALELHKKYPAEIIEIEANKYETEDLAIILTYTPSVKQIITYKTYFKEISLAEQEAAVKYMLETGKTKDLITTHSIDETISEELMKTLNQVAKFDAKKSTEFLNKRAAKIKAQFSAWSGSHTEIEWHIKSRLNDADSYEHVDTSYWDRVDHLVILTKFRAKNGFGAKMLRSFKAKVSAETGEIIEIVSDIQ